MFTQAPALLIKSCEKREEENCDQPFDLIEKQNFEVKKNKCAVVRSKKSPYLHVFPLNRSMKIKMSVSFLTCNMTASETLWLNTSSPS